jgi:hypothetical protein
MLRADLGFRAVGDLAEPVAQADGRPLARKGILICAYRDGGLTDEQKEMVNDTVTIYPIVGASVAFSPEDSSNSGVRYGTLAPTRA